ncbi:hypothetical protein C1752_04426 [Acaryochloris thomasi RCC1774]|uniref:Uncharacterized protein n=1 Tax=Acaryochloris thomasi RCC1774 TaxID=1764569 RepID=A0A2W1JDL8_9CYAN|nr:hypothetical protein C1752_04426 [Acaryochloris thomasi RCC1774]
MLCNSCLRQPACLTNKLASRDRNLKSMLQRLEHCELRIVRSVTKESKLTQLLRRLRNYQTQAFHLLFATKQPK